MDSLNRSSVAVHGGEDVKAIRDNYQSVTTSISHGKDQLDAGALFVLKSKGPRWSRYYVGPIQFVVCYGSVIGCILLGGQCMKAIYLLSSPNEKMKLYQFVVILGGLMLILAQIPSFHSLRHINMISLLLSLAYSACATAACIYIGSSSKGPEKDYSLSSNPESRVFGTFNAMAIIATTLGNGIIPEIQATLVPPVKGKMFKGLCVCYTIVD